MLLAIVTLAASGTSPCPLQDSEPSSSYRLGIVSTKPLQIAVRAEVPASARISVSDYGAWSQPRGWAQFIQSLEVRSQDGSLLEAVEDESGWRLPAASEARLALSYTVDLSHVDWPTWPDGPRTTSAYRGADGTFVLLAALLVQPELDTACELVFEGDHWGRIEAPFESLEPGTFSLNSLRQGAKNAIVFQVKEVTEVSVGGLQVQIVALDGASGTDSLPGLASHSLEEFAELFGTRLEGEYLAVVYPDQWDTGEAYEDSFVLATTQALTDETIPIWGQSITHEVIHRWLGKEIRGSSWADSNWFSEGVTDYAASLFLVRAGYVDAAVFLDQLEKHSAFHRLYHKGPPFAGLDLVSAGADKGPNNAAIYDGGWLTAFALDVELQERSSGSVGIEEFLRALHEFTSVVEGGYEIEDLVRLLEEVSGTDFRPFFDRHVWGAEPLELEELCSRAGIELLLGAVQAHARLDPSPEPTAQRIRERILAGTFAGRPAAISPRIDALFTAFDGVDRPGASLTVWSGDGVVHSRGYGEADLERGHPIRPDTVFHAASVSKQFTAFLVYLLEAEGRLSTADALVDWFPELSCGAGIRVQHLLDHTSGLRDQWQLLGLSGVRTDGDLVTHDDVLRLLFRQQGLCFEPGTEQAYCNSGYTLLAELVARAAGVSFSQLAKERIFEPLGMRRTFFQESPTRLIPDRALSYRRVQRGFEPAPLAFGTYGATGLMTTTEDLVKWGRNAWEQRVGASEIHDRMSSRGKLNDGTELNFTSGLQVRTWNGVQVVGHPGADAGYRSALLVVPDERTALALLGNVDTVDMWELPERVLELCLGLPREREQASDEGSDAETETLKSREDAPEAADLEPYVGTYYSPEVDTSYELKIEQGILRAHHVRNGAIPLELSAPDLLRCDRWYLSELEMQRGPRGEVTGFRAHSSRSRGVRFVRRESN